MADKTLIGWTDATWNIVTGCSMVSAGCTNCYAMGLAGSRLRHHPSRAGLTRETGGRSVWTGDVRFNEGWLDQPLRWRAPRRIFVCAHGDLFHEAVPDEWIDRVFAVMGECRQHTFQVLTKRPERMREYLDERRKGRPLMPSIGGGLLGYHPFNCEVMPPENIWLGTSIEDQATADARIPHLLATPAARRFVSAEPLLGALDLRITQARGSSRVLNALTGASFSETSLSALPRGPGLDLVIVGGESGPRARPMHPDWVRSLREQCVSAGVSFHFKQWGEWMFQSPEGRATGFYRVGKKAAGRLLDGHTWDEMPGSKGVQANDQT
ncbi:phage Gp37/Gp68 family protein [Rhodobacter capsulatus]|nr:phage Gp37/Gp68 family protein [Rhodobacter capsulatus]WER08406.1 phage Gp37/Gp68 family protein [Rhodobacter capsulatus]